MLMNDRFIECISLELKYERSLYDQKLTHSLIHSFAKMFCPYKMAERNQSWQERGGNFLLIQLLAKTTKQTLLCLTFPILSCLFA